MKLLAISMSDSIGWAFSPDHKRNSVLSGTREAFDLEDFFEKQTCWIEQLIKQYEPDAIAQAGFFRIGGTVFYTSADIRKFATGRKNGSAKRMLAEYRRLFDSEPVNLAEAEAFFALAKLAMSCKGE
jgi:hypothetical protein